MAELKLAYLISGDDEAKLDAWRARLRARAEAEGPSTTLEVLKGDGATAEATVDAIGSLTLSVGRRYVLVDGIERWNDRDQKRVEEALGGLSPETLVVFIAAGEAPARLAKAVKRRGGELHAYKTPSSYPAWLVEHTRELGVGIDKEAAQMLAELIGKDQHGKTPVERQRRRQQRLLRELEKLSVFVGEGGRIDTAAVDSLTSSAVEARVYELADAVIEQNAERALRLAEELRVQGDDNMMLILTTLSRQLRNCRHAQRMIAAGESLKEIQSALGGPPWKAKFVVAQARRADEEQLERALELLADLDYDVRGGGQLDSDSALTRLLRHAAGEPEPAAV